MNENYENLPNIFEGELESIIQILNNKEINYSLGKFLIRIGLNHLDEIERDDIHVGSSKSLNYDLVNDKQIFLDKQSLYLFLFDLKNKKHGIDTHFFQKFNADNLLQKLPLDDIDFLMSSLI